jgi:hypothetical protein
LSNKVRQRPAVSPSKPRRCPPSPHPSSEIRSLTAAAVDSLLRRGMAIRSSITWIDHPASVQPRFQRWVRSSVSITLFLNMRFIDCTLNPATYLGCCCQGFFNFFSDNVIQFRPQQFHGIVCNQQTTVPRQQGHKK